MSCGRSSRPRFSPEASASADSTASLFANEVDDVKPGDLAVKLKREERRVRVDSDAHLAMNTYGGMSAFQGRTPTFFRNLRGWSLPELVNLMKEEGALDPGAREDAFESPVAVLSQFLWGAPKLAPLLQQVRRAILGVGCDKPRDKRKMLIFVQLPKSGEVILKRVE